MGVDMWLCLVARLKKYVVKSHLYRVWINDNLHGVVFVRLHDPQMVVCLSIFRLRWGVGIQYSTSEADSQEQEAQTLS